MPRQREFRYKGILLKPIPRGVVPWTVWAETKDQTRTRRAEARFENEFQARIDALFRHYGIDREEGGSPWKRLAVQLAIGHVPGFRLQEDNVRRRGAPTKWTFARLNTLCHDVETLMSKGLSASGACHNLVKRQEYEGLSGKTLLRRFQDRPSFLELVARSLTRRPVQI